MKGMEKLAKMLSDKEGCDMSEKEIMAKMDVLQELLDLASTKAGDDVIGGLKKVTVAAPDKEGLKQGLKKAEDIMEEMPEKMMASEESDEEDMDEEDEEEEA